MSLDATNLPAAAFNRALKLQYLCLVACDNRDEFDEQAFRFLKGEFGPGFKPAGCSPQFLWGLHTKQTLKEWLWEKAETAEGRRDYVIEQFAPLIKFLQGDDPEILRRDGGPAMLDGRAARPEPSKAASNESEGKGGEADSGWTDVDPFDPSEDRVVSSRWTGRAGRAERAKLIVSLAPAALEGVRALLTEHEGRLHNGPPEAVAPDAIQSLRELHAALGELIALVEADRSFEAQLDRLQSLRARVFQFASETGELCVAGMKPLLASLPAAFGTWILLGLICAPETMAILGPVAATSVVGGYFGLELKRTETGPKAKENGGRGKD